MSSPVDQWLGLDFPPQPKTPAPQVMDTIDRPKRVPWLRWFGVGSAAAAAAAAYYVRWGW